MSWKPKPDIDENVRQWMKAEGWEVTTTDYDFDREVYAWRHKARGSHLVEEVGASAVGIERGA